MSPHEQLLRPRPRTSPLPWLGAAALLLAASWISIDAHRVGESVLADQQKLAQSRAAVKPPPVQHLSREDRERDKRWAALRIERHFQWYPIFRSLEAASSPDVELLEFAPDKAGKAFTLRGEARDAQALLTYLSSLSGQQAFASVHLSHQFLNQRGAMKVFAFEIKGRLR